MESPTGSLGGASLFSNAPTLVDALEFTFADNRLDHLTEEGIVITPLGVLKDLATDWGARIDEKTFEIHLPGSGPESIRYRVILTVGLFNGHGEACRHRLALQLASGDLLERMKEKGHDIPSYGLLPGCRVNPIIYRDLEEFCEMEEFSLPVYTRIEPSLVKSAQNFAFKCIVGQAEFVGVSDSIFLAKRLAAKGMYEELTGEEYPSDRIATGSGCLNLDDLMGMGITPQQSMRAQQRELEDFAEPDETDGIPKKSRPIRRRRVDCYEDDFADEGDDVGIIGHKIEAMELIEKKEPVDVDFI